MILDSNVLLYAVGDREHPLAGPARKVLRDVASGQVHASSTPMVLQEVLHVIGRRRPRQAAVRAVQHFTALLAPLVQVETDDVTRGADLFGHHAGLGAVDAVLAATAIRLGRPLLSADGAFAAVEDLDHRAL